MSSIETTPGETLDAPYPLTREQIRRFEADGYIRLAHVLDAATLARHGAEITRLTLEANPHKDKPLEQRDTYHRAFIQVSQLWRRNELAREFSFSRRLARIAAELLGVAGVRMYHDQALYKEPGGGFTPWHVDQQYWPLASDRCVTAWIPLQATPREMGPLCFGRGSHRHEVGRDLKIGEDSERIIAQRIHELGIEEVFEPFELGDVSFHLGWTLHRAGPNTTAEPRKVHTVIYMDAAMRLEPDMTETQKVDWQAFSPSTQPGELMDDALNPVLYEAGGAANA